MPYTVPLWTDRRLPQHTPQSGPQSSSDRSATRCPVRMPTPRLCVPGLGEPYNTTIQAVLVSRFPMFRRRPGSVIFTGLSSHCTTGVNHLGYSFGSCDQLCHGRLTILTLSRSRNVLLFIVVSHVTKCVECCTDSCSP